MFYKNISISIQFIVFIQAPSVKEGHCKSDVDCEAMTGEILPGGSGKKTSINITMFSVRGQ